MSPPWFLRERVEVAEGGLVDRIAPVDELEGLVRDWVTKRLKSEIPCVV